MKYNKSNIMKRAWELKKLFGEKKSFSICLYRAWNEAKEEAEANYYNCKDFVNGMEITMNGVTRTLNRWTKNGMDRVYINNDRNSDGYVDLIAHKAIGGKGCGYDYHKNIVAAILSMNFKSNSQHK